MTSRERIRAIVTGELPDRVGVYEHYWGETIPAWREQGFPADRGPDSLFGHDLIELGSVDATPLRGYSEVVEEDELRRVTKDGRGATMRLWKARSGVPEHLGFDCVTPEIWKERYREPLLSLDLARIDRDNLSKALDTQLGGDKFVCLNSGFVYEWMRGSLGDVVMLESMYLEPEWIHDFCRVYTDFHKEHFAWIFDNLARPDGMFIYEDLGFRNGPFMRPAQYAEMVQPYHTELVSFFHDYGIPVILHSCGDVRQLFDHLVESGWDCLQPMEAKSGNNVLAFADRLDELGRRMGFMGNIDVTVLNTGDQARIRHEVASKVGELVRRGMGYCFHSDHSVPPDISYESYKLAWEVAREVGVYGGS
ncbi:MAG: hypothetical protein HYU66_00265 [Armatimonadetes bacterium]|nr:hypothetical protein [Armatimonadota bacterium]